LEALPRLRYVDAFPVDVDGQRLIYLRDPEGFAKEGLGVPPHVFHLMTLLDGTHSAEDLRTVFEEANEGGTITDEQIEEMVTSLDEALLLDSDRFRAHKEDIVDAYRRETRRPSALAGSSYPDSPEALRLLIDSFFTDQTGPPEAPEETNPVTALVAPHIDFGRGGPCFAWAYKQLKDTEPADVYVVLGTGHSSRRPFTASRKVFETPLGDLPADQTFIDRLTAHSSQDLFSDELAHRNEHSIEFQAVFLKYLFADSDISFVPILCGSFFQSVNRQQSPMEDPEVAEFVSALRRTIDEDDRTICLIAGVDFSHVGQRFGDEAPLDDEFITRVKASDDDLITAAAAGDAEGFFDVIVRDCDQNRVCGTSSIYTMLKVMDGEKGQLLKYDQAIDQESGSLVSFASMAWHKTNDK
jgi:MEMO1 family protein